MRRRQESTPRGYQRDRTILAIALTSLARRFLYPFVQAGHHRCETRASHIEILMAYRASDCLFATHALLNPPPMSTAA